MICRKAQSRVQSQRESIIKTRACDSLCKVPETIAHGVGILAEDERSIGSMARRAPRPVPDVMTLQVSVSDIKLDSGSLSIYKAYKKYCSTQTQILQMFTESLEKS